MISNLKKIINLISYIKLKEHSIELFINQFNTFFKSLLWVLKFRRKDI